MSSQTTPASKPHPVLVTAAVIRDGERILLAQRQLNSSVEGGKWEFPGGKVEHCEKPEDCLVREIREELNLEIQVDSLFDVVSHVYERPSGPMHVVLLCYLCRMTGGELKLLEANDARWIVASELDRFEFAAADVPIVQKLKEFVSIA